MNRNKKTLDRNHYSHNTLFVFNNIATYIADLYYNHLYFQAKKFKCDRPQEIKTITDGYKHAIYALVTAFGEKSRRYNPEHYNRILISITDVFKVRGTAVLTINDCIDVITKELIPNDYFESIERIKRGGILKKILLSVIKETGTLVYDEFLVDIIDHHDEPSNIIAIRDRIVDLLLLQREQVYHQFLSANSDNSGEKVDKSLAIKLQSEIKQLKQNEKLLTDKIRELQYACDVRTKQTAQLLAKYKSLNKQNQSLAEEYNAVKAQLQKQHLQRAQQVIANEPHAAVRSDWVESSPLMEPHAVARSRIEQSGTPAMHQAHTSQPTPQYKSMAPQMPTNKQPHMQSGNKSNAASISNMQEILDKHTQEDNQAVQLAKKLSTTVADSDAESEASESETIHDPEPQLPAEDYKNAQAIKRAVTQIKRDLGNDPSLADIF